MAGEDKALRRVNELRRGPILHQALEGKRRKSEVSVTTYEPGISILG